MRQQARLSAPLPGGVQGSACLPWFTCGLKDREAQWLQHAVNPPLRLGKALQILKRLIAYAFPISAGSLVLPLVQVIDTVIIPKRLQTVGFTVQEATSQFGQLSGMAGTVVYLTGRSNGFHCHDTGPLTWQQLSPATTAPRFTGGSIQPCALPSFSVFPRAAGLMLLATPIMELLFDDSCAGCGYCLACPCRPVYRPPADHSRRSAGDREYLAACGKPYGRLPGQGLLQLLPDSDSGLRDQGSCSGQHLGFLLVFLLNIFWLTRLTDYRPRIGILLRPPPGCYNNDHGDPCHLYHLRPLWAT